MKQYLSYSEIRLFLEDRDEYYKRYILGEDGIKNDKMKLGTIIHSALENNRFEWIKALKEQGFIKYKKQIRKILDKMEFKKQGECEVGIRAETKDGIKLFGIFDGLDRKNRILIEYKTTDLGYWCQKLVDNNEQLSFYAYMYWLTYHKFFTEIRLYAINYQKGTVKMFQTIRSIKDIFEIKTKTENIVKELKRIGWWEKRLSNHEKYNQKLPL